MTAYRGFTIIRVDGGYLGRRERHEEGFAELNNDEIEPSARFSVDVSDELTGATEADLKARIVEALGAPPNAPQGIDAYHFRNLHPHVRFGTASDRYAAWIGQIYPERYRDEITSSKRKIGGKTLAEERVPVESVREYFEHLDVLEIDHTFYSPLRTWDGVMTKAGVQLQELAAYAPDDARILLKAPQIFFARKFRRGRGKDVTHVENDDFLNVDMYVREFLEPAKEILGSRLGGITFQQEYQRKSDPPSVEQNIAELDTFFGAIPSDVQSHIELRSPHLLERSYFDWLESRGVGHVFSHWTYLPSIGEQWKMTGGRFTAADGTASVRLLTPPKVKYEDAYVKAHPFDRDLPELADAPWAGRMTDDLLALIRHAEEMGVTVDVLINNRATGNAPTLIQRIARRLHD